ncbi:uncharacterized protein TRIREDRAFT_112514 [Trichoderma reesei QM6a]|uniref:Predicted protein n=1 Tax=Hypocrea jecorina (strain QM6a) TaxID=431241 RepID=G0RX91_HYPJQ|nr:uncharacterized protein TRIREDRAFT_112514 [Trichoderma reesei QM6a]EGR44215.1 predicted protein [Trichoderma reesei QM6a]
MAAQMCQSPGFWGVRSPITVRLRLWYRPSPKPCRRDRWAAGVLEARSPGTVDSRPPSRQEYYRRCITSRLRLVSASHATSLASWSPRESVQAYTDIDAAKAPKCRLSAGEPGRETVTVRLRTDGLKSQFASDPAELLGAASTYIPRSRSSSLITKRSCSAALTYFTDGGDLDRQPATCRQTKQAARLSNLDDSVQQPTGLVSGDWNGGYRGKKRHRDRVSGAVGDGSEKDSDDGTEGDHGRMRASSCVQPSALNDLTGLHIFRSDAALSTSAVDIEQGKVSSSGNVPLSGSEPRLWSLEEDGDDLVKNMDFTPENPNWRRNRKTSDRLHHSTGYLFPGAASMRPEVAVRPKGTSQGTS